MNSERLLKLAEFLETDPRVKDHFDMALIVSDGFDPKALGCGAAACAIGWTPVVFPEAWRYEDDCAVLRLPKGTAFDFDAAELFYGIDRKQSVYLFSLSWYAEAEWDTDTRTFQSSSIPPTTVAKRIRDFVASGGKIPE